MFATLHTQKSHIILNIYIYTHTHIKSQPYLIH